MVTWVKGEGAKGKSHTVGRLGDPGTGRAAPFIQGDSSAAVSMMAPAEGLMALRVWGGGLGCVG